ncbi:uncharacterized protein si:dkey-220k22.3 [Pangasianodon hypophthalmus]|uniref:uncharacterized protein si:dkey-220k22.3 n=1 Tax=Pangasianodon hypophthalmus TaxID=310915 RepID=UPI00147D40B2|nr:uncharacterized protein si:dkey-220k22.3 [Pangasianodon hypophthalmus]
MAHAARAHLTWMSAVIMVAVTASCLTWLIVSREKPSARIISGTLVADMFRLPSSPEHCLFKVNTSAEDSRLAWVKEWNTDNIFLDENKTWISVAKPGVYLVYIQLTYSLKKDGNSSSVDLMLRVEFSYPEGKEEFSGAFDTRQLTEKEQDAHLSTFLLLQMRAGNRLSILAYPKDRMKYDDVRPFSSYIAIIRYADWSG